MLIFLAILGTLAVLGVWALYMRVGLIYENWWERTRAHQDFLREEFALIWTAVSSRSRAERIERFGLGPCHVFERQIAKRIPQDDAYYEGLKEKLERAEKRWWDYGDAADRDAKRRAVEKLRIEAKMASAQATFEEQEAWEKELEKEATLTAQADSSQRSGS